MKPVGLWVFGMVSLASLVGCGGGGGGAPANTPPVASLTVSPRATDVGSPVQFDASGSTDAQDPVGSLQVRWDWEADGTWDTEFSISKTATHTYATPGTYSVALAVKDSGGLVSVKVKQVKIGPNEPPQAAFSITPVSGDTGTTFAVDATATTDDRDETSTIQVRWDWESNGDWDTSYTVAKTATHRYSSRMPVKITMEARDSAGLVSQATRDITVSMPPKAALSVTGTPAEIGAPIAFDASGSTDPEDAPADLSVRWDWEADGTWDTAYSTSKAANHAYAVAGAYSVVVEVKDSTGFTDQASAQVVVLVPDAPPTAAFTVTPGTGSTDDTFTLDASACMDDRTPATDLQVRWDFDGDGTWDTSFSTDKVLDRVYELPGTFAVLMQVRDGGGLASTTSRSLEVQALPPPVAYRTLSSRTYAVGVPINVTIVVTPGAYLTQAVVDTPPPGWTVTNMSDDVRLEEATGKLLWLGSGASPHTVSYTVTPPAGASGHQTFSGVFYADTGPPPPPSRADVPPFYDIRGMTGLDPLP